MTSPGTSAADEQRRLSQQWPTDIDAATAQHHHLPPAQSINVPAAQNGSFPLSQTAAQTPLLSFINAASSASDGNSMLQVLQQLQQQTAQQQQQMAQQQQSIAQLLKQQPQVHPQPAIISNPESISAGIAKQINEFRFEPEPGITFEAWYSRYEGLLTKDAAQLDEAARVRLLLRKLGPMEHERLINFILPSLPHDFSFDAILDKLKQLFGKSESLLSRRFKCFNVTRPKSEDMLAYASRVNRACIDFELGKLTEDQLKCLVFVCGLREEEDTDIRTRLLARIEDKRDMSLDQLAAECKRLDTIKKQGAMITRPTEQVLAVKSGEQQQSAAMPHQQPFQQRSTFSARGRRIQQNNENVSFAKPKNPCWLCGALHWMRECTFTNHTCTDCGRTGHRDGFCNTANRRRVKRETIYNRVVTVNVCRVKQKRKYVNALINGVTTQLQLDTGSDITIINQNLWERLGKPRLRKPTVRARSAAGSNLQLEGEFEADISIGSTSRQATVRVIRADLLLLGADLVDLFDLGSVPMNTFCNRVSADSVSKSLEGKFPAVFTGVGLCTKACIKLQLKPDARPVFRPKRPVAYAVLESVDKELDRLEKLKIISPVDYSEWAAPIVIVRKSNGNLRICGDYSTGLNAALLPYEYPLPLPDDIFAKLAGCKLFSKIDLSDAFLQVEIDSQYRSLLTINTHRGLYHYNRLPPGIKIAPAAFQQLIDTMLAGLSGSSGYMDDVVVGGKTEEEHDENLERLLRRIQEYGFTVRAEKCAFRTDQIEYLGFIIDRQGLRPNPTKIEVIKNLPTPTNISEVRSFLGAINYYGKFLPRMRDLRYPLDKLLTNSNDFVWSAECETAFKNFKALLCSPLFLTHYDPNAEIIVAADASSVGIGATLSHRFSDGSIKVVQHASRALTKSEQGYSQIDREGLAIVFAVKKFHKMIYGRQFRLQTDHRPLLRIFGSKKGIPVYTANRLQRFALTLQLYDFDIEYVSTEKFGNADILSRLIKGQAKLDEDYVIARINLENDIRALAINALSAYPLSFRDVEHETMNDTTLKKVLRYLREGWPQNSSFSGELARFHARQESLSEIEGCILFGERVVIPRILQQRCLAQLHLGHPGIQRMKALARSHIYWPLIDEDIKEIVLTCQACQAAAKSPVHSTPVSWPDASAPWQRVHIDYAGPINGDYFLLIIDAFSKWPEIVKTSSTTSASTIAVLRSIFARFGLPITIVSDNGTQFTSAEFAEFCSRNGIEHKTIPPFHPQSNGQAERFVDTFKRALKKITFDISSPQHALDIFLQTYRSTPNPQLHHSTPASVMFGRNIRTCLELLHPIKKKEANIQNEQEREFSPGHFVFAKIYSRNTWKWTPGVIIKRRGNVLYDVSTTERGVIKSHINQLRRRMDDNQQHPQRRATTFNTLLDAWSLLEPFEAESSTVEQPPVPSRSSLSSSVPSQPVTSSTTTTTSQPASFTIAESKPCFNTADPNSNPILTKEPTTSASPLLRPMQTQPVLPPRRSSRVRRVPRRLHPYQTS
ncbi:uncharacterized protein K02A2.6-like [Anopheles funestus]|uniref:uncharacterized protein K02A2.6-like n=1 Tax=Anopheles funestus TaxID=62324 RepID=UPI0020C7041F|nr:uncharacterized protein K02A2.6-like [Anopheles funestus]